MRKLISKLHAPPLTRRFHRRAGDQLKRWEVSVWNALFSSQPEARLWANVLADGIYIIYRSRHRRSVERELRWLTRESDPTLLSFDSLAVAFDIEPDIARADILNDVRSGRIAAKDVRIPC